MVSIWTILIFLIILLLTIRSILFRYSRVKILGDKIPGPFPYPIIGNALLAFCSTDEVVNVLKRLISEYGDVVRGWILRDLYVGLSNPDDIQPILRNSKNKKIKPLTCFANPFLGDGLITADVNIWQVHRKALTPAFHFKMLEHSIQVIHKNAQILVNILDEKVGKPEFDVHEYVMRFSFQVACGASMGVDFDFQRSTDNSNSIHLIDAIVGCIEIITNRIYKVWLHPEILFRLSKYHKKFTSFVRYVDKGMKEIIAKRREVLEKVGDNKVNGGKKYAQFMDLMFQENFTDKEIMDEVKTFIVAGHDTTNCAIDFLIYALSQHTDIQDKIYEELKNLSLYVNNSRPTMEQLNNQKYLESVIKESLRMYTPVPIIVRELVEDVTTTGGLVLPSGTGVALLISEVHRNEKYYENCDTFDPERFLHDDKNRNPFAYIPFSAGPRNCIGQKFAMLEIKIIIGMLINKFKILPSDTNEELELGYRITLRSKNGIHIKLAHRNNKK